MRSARRERENESRRRRYAEDPAYRERRLAQTVATTRAAKPETPEAREARRARYKAWYDAHPRSWDPALRRTHKATRRARKRDAFVEHVNALVVLERDDGVCGICGGDVDPTNFDVDHVVALAAGGLHAYFNVQAAHPTCNRSKGMR
jgi:5-methylcytosine-specific restriction endonuclease McrA